MLKFLHGAAGYAYRKAGMPQVRRWLEVRLRPDRWYSEKAPDFLVVGLQKSGTYWVTALLDSHPEVTAFPSLPGGASGVQEGHFFDTLGQIDSDRDWYRFVFERKHGAFFRDLVRLTDRVPRDELLDRFRRRYNAFVQKQREGRLVGDKTAEYVFHLDLIDRLYPGMKKVCILRDPRDRLVSFHFHQLRKGVIENEEIQDREVEEYVQRMVREHSILLAYEGEIRFTSYEGLARSATDEVEGLLAYLGVERSEETVRRVIEGARFTRLSGREKGDADRDSYYRKGVVGDWRNHLSSGQVELIHRELDSLLERLHARKGVAVRSYLGSPAESGSEVG